MRLWISAIFCAAVFVLSECPSAYSQTADEISRAEGFIAGLDRRGGEVLIYRDDDKPLRAEAGQLLLRGDRIEIVAGNPLVYLDIQGAAEQLRLPDGSNRSYVVRSGRSESSSGGVLARLGSWFRALFEPNRVIRSRETIPRASLNTGPIQPHPFYPAARQIIVIGKSAFPVMWRGAAARVSIEQNGKVFGSTNDVGRNYISFDQASGLDTRLVFGWTPTRLGKYNHMQGTINSLPSNPILGVERRSGSDANPQLRADTVSVRVVEQSGRELALEFELSPSLPKSPWPQSGPLTSDAELLVEICWLLGLAGAEPEPKGAWKVEGIARLEVLSKHYFPARRLLKAIVDGEIAQTGQ